MQPSSEVVPLVSKSFHSNWNQEFVSSNKKFESQDQKQAEYMQWRLQSILIKIIQIAASSSFYDYYSAFRFKFPSSLKPHWHQRSRNNNSTICQNYSLPCSRTNQEAWTRENIKFQGNWRSMKNDEEVFTTIISTRFKGDVGKEAREKSRFYSNVLSNESYLLTSVWFLLPLR